MDFDRLLDRVLALVNERGRVSLAALGEYFDLNEQRLAAVRDELVDARGAVALEGGRILVSRRDDSPPDAASAAERRHLTVMFVDLVGSTDLSTRLDPEDLRELVRRYQETVALAIERFNGYVAQYLGDGVLVYFGYPHAHDDDARRAVYAAHDILQRLPELNAELADAFRASVSVRIGIHTGLVVVGDVGAGARHESLALGEVPNVAARLQSAAGLNEIFLSAPTQALLGDQFELDARGAQSLKGLPEPLDVYRSLRPSGVASAFDLAVKHKLLPLAGRRDELSALNAAWAAARNGQGQTILVSGDAGIGKSRLIQALKDQLTDRDERWTALRASAYHTNTPLYPVIALLRQTIGIDERDSDAVNFMRIKSSLEDLDAEGTESAALIATLCDVSLPDTLARPVELRRAPQVFAEMFMLFLLREPRLLVVEDVHWLDPTTLALTRGLIERAPGEALLVVVSARPGFDPATLAGASDRVSRIDLGPLPRADVDTMIRSVAGERALSSDVVDAIARRTDGVPAFVEELSRMLLSSDWLIEKDGELVPGGPLPTGIPDTLTDSLMARLDRLGDAKAVAQEASVLGRTFSGALLGAVSQLDTARLDRALHDLSSAQVIRRRTHIGEDNWRFRHALLQDAAYQSLLRSTRQSLHLAVAQAMEGQFQAQAAQQPERVARHFQLGGDAAHALGYWQWAAERALEKSATIEALSHVQEGLDLLVTLPHSELRDQRELSLLSMKGSSLILINGWAADGLGAVYERSLELVSRGGRGAHVDYQVLGGLCAYHLVRGEFDTVELLTERLIQQGKTFNDAASLTVAHVCRCIGGFSSGRFEAARESAEAVTLHYEPKEVGEVSFLYGQDPVVITQTVIALMTFAEGDAAAALSLSEHITASAQALPGRFSALWANAWHARLLYELGRYDAALELAMATWRTCEEFGFAYVGVMAELVVGVAHIGLGDAVTGLEHVRKALQSHSLNPSALARNYFNALVIEAEAATGHEADARTMIESLLEGLDEQADVAWRSELYRLYGVLTAASDTDVADAAFERAVGESVSIGAHRLALRAATSWLDVSPGNPLAGEAVERSLNGQTWSSEDRDAQYARARLNRG